MQSREPTEAVIVVDLGFGDAGKGTIVDYLARTTGALTVVRFNGGPQAGHNVVTVDGRHHTFSQFGSGTFVPGVRTILAGPMLIEPYAMLRALRSYTSQSLSDAGLTGSAVGPLGAAADWEVLADPAWIDFAVEQYRTAASRFCLTDDDEIARMLGGSGTVIFEGAQGVLLDENFGFHPHTTWSDTTAANAMWLLDRAGVTSVRRIGVVRTYATRHGTGPMVSEDRSLEGLLTEPHNTETGPQGRFPVGHFDAVATRYAIGRCPVDEIAVTHLDRLGMLPPVVCEQYTGGGFGLDAGGQISPVPRDNFSRRSEQTRTLLECKPVLVERPNDRDRFLADLSARLGVRVGIVSAGPTAAEKQELLV